MIREVLVYATSERGLLVFDEPDFPAAGVQVPGGTVELGESDLEAAAREFHEETGLDVHLGFEPLGAMDFMAGHDGALVSRRRAYFRTRLPRGLPESWPHREESPASSGGPILFRFFWLGHDEAQARLDPVTGRLLDGIASV